MRSIEWRFDLGNTVEGYVKRAYIDKGWRLAERSVGPRDRSRGLSPIIYVLERGRWFWKEQEILFTEVM